MPPDQTYNNFGTTCAGNDLKSNYSVFKVIKQRVTETKRGVEKERARKRERERAKERDRERETERDGEIVR